MTYSCGWLQDTPDARDFALPIGELPAEEVPSAASVAHLLGEPFNQGQLRSCCAETVAKLFFAAARRAGAYDPQVMSRLAIWFLARLAAGTQRLNAGTQLRTVFKTINRFGFCPEAVWPHDTDPTPGAPFSRTPPVKSFVLAHDQSAAGQKPARYRRIYEQGADRLTAVRRCIASGLPVGFGTDVSHAFVTPGFQAGVPLNPPAPRDVAGGHAMVLGAYNEHGFLALSSYGAGWNGTGWCPMSEDYVAWDRTSDLWTVELAPWFARVSA